MKENCDNLIKQVKKLIEEDKCEKAIILTDTIIANDINNSEVYFLRAKAKSLTTNDFNSVIEDYSQHFSAFITICQNYSYAYD